MDIELLQNPAEDSSKRNSKKRRKRRAKKVAMEKNGPQIMDKMDGNVKASDKLGDCILVNNDLETNLLTTDLAVHAPADSLKMAAGSTDNPLEVTANRKMKNRRRKIKKKAKIKVVVQSIDVKLAENEFTTQESEFSLEKESSLSNLVHDKENPSDLCKDEETVLLPDVVEVSNNGVASGLLEERPGHFLKPMEVEENVLPCESQHSSQPNQMAGEIKLNEVNNEIVVDQGKCSAEGRSVLSTCDVELTTHISSPDVKEAECLFKDSGLRPLIAPIASIKRKLLVLDVNGLLANIVMPALKDCRGDTHILGRAIFKRPFCDDFLKFCFQNFDVGVWSSRSKRIIDRVVDYLLGDLKDRLLFCWDMFHSTQTGFKTLENSHKPLVCKELRKIWENDDPNLPWKKGDYDESNTLLLDDSPYKALLNPLHTAIFPNSYHYEDKNDNSLGPGGDLRVYLEGLLASENVQKYVEQHPFGQSAINETSLSWGFYSGVLQTLSIRLEDNTPSSLPTLSSHL